MSDFLDSFNEDKRHDRDAMRERFRVAREVVKEEARKKAAEEPRTQEAKKRAEEAALAELERMMELTSQEADRGTDILPPIESEGSDAEDIVPRERIQLEQKTHSMEMGGDSDSGGGTAGAQEDRVTPPDVEPPSADGHPFKGTVKNATTITVARGFIRYFQGAGPAVEATPNEVSESDVTVGVAGTIWLPMGISLSGSLAEAVEVDLTDDTLTLSTYRLSVLSEEPYTITPDAAGTLGWTEEGSPDQAIFRRILDFDTINGVLTVTEQYERDHIFISEFLVWGGSVAK